MKALIFLISITCIAVNAIVIESPTKVEAAVAYNTTRPRQWWENANYYQIYPRSFFDSDNNGIGDLKGIMQKSQYLKDLGMDAIWLSPIMKSPMVVRVPLLF